MAASASGSGTKNRGSEQRDLTTTEAKSEKLVIDDIAIEKIIQDVLGGAEGLAAIFQGEQTAGIFNSSVTAQAAGDLATKLAGEIAKLTAERTSEVTSKQKGKIHTRGMQLTRSEEAEFDFSKLASA